MSDRIKFLLPEESIPESWYNIVADLPEPPPAVLHPGTHLPLVADDLRPLFPDALIAQEMATARDIGYGAYFPEQAGAIEDDHMPCIKLGVNAIDLIDFDYGPGHSYWHTEKDTIDKISAKSLQIVGEVLLEVFRRLQQ